MRVHALTLNWNGEDKLEKLRDGLCENLSAFYMRDGDIAEWHIRDNGSKDNSVKNIRNWSCKSDHNVKTVLHQVGHNRDNFAQGMNYLFDQANPADDDLVFFINNDLEFGDSHSLLKMWQLMKKTGAGVVGARLLYTNSDKLAHAGVIFGPRYGNMPFHYRWGEKSDIAAEKNRYFQAVTAACCLVNPTSFRKINGFDENFKWAFDDIDLNLRIGKTEKIVYCGGVKIYHEESASLKKNPVNKLFLNHNVKYFKEKWFGKYELDHEKYLANSKYNEIG